VREKRPSENVVLEPSGDGTSRWQRLLGAHGGTTVVLFKLVRLLSLFALALLSALQALTNGINTERKEPIGLDTVFTIIYVRIFLLVVGFKGANEA